MKSKGTTVKMCESMSSPLGVIIYIILSIGFFVAWWYLVKEVWDLDKLRREMKKGTKADKSLYVPLECWMRIAFGILWGTIVIIALPLVYILITLIVYNQYFYDWIVLGK